MAKSPEDATIAGFIAVCAVVVFIVVLFLIAYLRAGGVIWPLS